MLGKVDNVKKSVCPVCIKVVASGKEATCRTCGAELVQVSETLLASIPDQPGALAELLEKIAQKGVNIKALRAMPRENGAALAFFSVDRVEEVLTILGCEIQSPEKVNRKSTKRGWDICPICVLID